MWTPNKCLCLQALFSHGTANNKKLDENLTMRLCSLKVVKELWGRPQSKGLTARRGCDRLGAGLDKIFMENSSWHLHANYTLHTISYCSMGATNSSVCSCVWKSHFSTCCECKLKSKKKGMSLSLCLLELLDVRNAISPCLHFCCTNNNDLIFTCTNKLEYQN